MSRSVTAAAAPPMRSDSRRKRNAILDAAGDLFIEQGFGATSVDAVADRAQVSKATVYAHFDNKEALFAAVMKARCAYVVPPSLADIAPHGEDTAIVLKRLGLLFLENIYQPGQIKLFRAVIMESAQFPEVGQMMFNGPVSRSHQLIGEYLTLQVAAGKLTLPCPEIAASQFLGLLKTDVQMQLLFNQPVSVSRARLRHIVDCAVELFLHGCAPRTSSKRR